MKRALKYLNDKEKGEHINISIISWDGDVDFVYSDITNMNFVPVQQAENDLPLIMRNFTCTETEPTLFNVGLNKAFEILKNDPNQIYPNNQRMLLFIVGKGEFGPWIQDKNFDKNVPIFVLGIEVKQPSLMNTTLTNIATMGPEGYQYTIKPSMANNFEKFIKRIFGDDPNFDDKIIKLLKKGLSSPILYNLTISDNINPFIEINPDSIRVNGLAKGFTTSINKNKTNILLEIPSALSSGSEIEIYYDTRINLTLPTSQDVDNMILSQKFLKDGRSGTLIQYNWQDGNKYKISIPTNYLHIFS